jgi:hypothetical protein
MCLLVRKHLPKATLVICALIGGILYKGTGIMPGSGLIGSLIAATTGAVVFLI